MATYLSRIRAISGSTSTQTSNAQVVDFLKSSVNYIIQSVPKDMLWFAYTDANLTSSTGVVVPRNTIISVKRNGIECDELSNKFIYATVTTLTSLYAGTTLFPKHYIKSGKVYIHPTPTTGQAGVVTYVNLSSTLITTSTSASDTTLLPLDAPFVNYAAGMDYVSLSGYWAQKAGDAQDALDKAKYLIDSATNLSQGEDVEDALAEEDTELMSAGVNVAAQEINRANANISYYNSKSQLLSKKSEMMFQLADKQIKDYIQINGGKV